MAEWTKTELTTIAAADDLHISPFREDGVTYGTLIWIWSVVVDGRALRTRVQPTKLSLVPGCLAADGGTNHGCWNHKRSEFARVDGPVNDRIDEAYRTKYKDSPYLAPMIAAKARSATVKVHRRETKENKP